MKIYDFNRKDLEEIPMIKENEEFECNLDNNSLTQIEYLNNNCIKLSLCYNK